VIFIILYRRGVVKSQRPEIQRGNAPISQLIEIYWPLLNYHKFNDSQFVKKITLYTPIKPPSLIEIVAEFSQYIESYPTVKGDGVINRQRTIPHSYIGTFEVPSAGKSPNETSHWKRERVQH